MINKLKNGLIGISHIIVDEIHERQANVEFLLIIFKEMVLKYPDFKIVLLSANANLTTFINYFNECSVINVLGQCYPVKSLV